jgi:hypothetical protein
MKVKNIGNNQTEIQFVCGTIVLVSYETPVAALLPSGRYIKTSTKYSRTTSKHINQWLCGTYAEEVNQEELNRIMK